MTASSNLPLKWRAMPLHLLTSPCLVATLLGDTFVLMDVKELKCLTFEEWLLLDEDVCHQVTSNG